VIRNSTYPSALVRKATVSVEEGGSRQRMKPRAFIRMGLTTMAPCSDQSANMQVKFRIPAEASTSEGRKLSAVVAACADDRHFLGATREFNVNSAESSGVRMVGDGIVCASPAAG
jgi:hypothetical protein